MPDSRWTGRGWRLLATLAVALGVFAGSGWIGFPRIFQWYFVGYVLLAVPFFRFLNARPARPPRRPGLAIFGFFLVLSALFTGAGFLLPQYDPRGEVEKIKRLQQVVREREEARQLDALGRLAEKRGLTVARAGEAPAALPAAPGPASSVAGSPPGAAPGAGVADPGLADRGRQVYEDYECYNCHKVGGKGGVKRRGPELDSTGILLSPEMIRAKLLDPLVFMSEGYEEEYRKTIMPDDLKDRMGAKEIEALVAYLASLRNDKATPPTPAPLFRTPTGWTTIPREFQKRVPRGWWTDPTVIRRGKQIYEGAVKPEVTCAACHGRDGQPVLTGARDFRSSAYVAKMSDTYWFWRLSEGVPQTAMTPMKDKLTEEERWQAIAYQHTFSHGGRAEEHLH